MDKNFETAVNHLKCNRLDKALSLLNELIIKQPQKSEYYSERGVVYFHMNRKKLSLADMDKAVNIDPKNPYRYSSRAYIRGHYRMFEGAIADYQKAIELDPEDAIALNNLGLIQEQMGYHNKAIENFKKADQLQGIETKHGNNNLGIKGEELTPRNIQKEINEERKNESFTKAIKSVFSKEGFQSYLTFIKSGFKKV